MNANEPIGITDSEISNTERTPYRDLEENNIFISPTQLNKIINDNIKNYFNNTVAKAKEKVPNCIKRWGSRNKIQVKNATKFGTAIGISNAIIELIKLFVI